MQERGVLCLWKVYGKFYQHPDDTVADILKLQLSILFKDITCVRIKHIILHLRDFIVYYFIVSLDLGQKWKKTVASCKQPTVPGR